MKIIHVTVPLTIEVEINETYPKGVRAVLEKRGWVKTAEAKRGMEYWVKQDFAGGARGTEFYEVGIPLMLDFVDFADCFETMLKTFSKAEGVTMKEALDILEKEGKKWTETE